MLLYTGKKIHSEYWLELPIYGDVVERLEDLSKILKHPNFYQYPMFEWAPGILIMDETTKNEDKGSNEEIYEIKLIEEIVDEII